MPPSALRRTRGAQGARSKAWCGAAIGAARFGRLSAEGEAFGAARIFAGLRRELEQGQPEMLRRIGMSDLVRHADVGAP